MLKMDSETMKAMKDLCDYIDVWSDKIYVREQIDGIWVTISLANLSGDLAIKHAMKFVRELRMPVRVLE